MWMRPAIRAVVTCTRDGGSCRCSAIRSPVSRLAIEDARRPVPVTSMVSRLPRRVVSLASRCEPCSPYSLATASQRIFSSRQFRRCRVSSSMRMNAYPRPAPAP